MKKLLLTTAIVMSFGGTAAFAHHPAEEFVDPDIYAMIDQNVSDVHNALTFEDMGSDVMGGDTDVGGDSDVGGTAVSLDTEVGNMGAETGGDVEDVGAEIGENMEDIGAAAEAREEMNATAATEPSGPGAQRQYCP